MPTQRAGIPNPKLNAPIQCSSLNALQSLIEFQQIEQVPTLEVPTQPTQLPAMERPPSPSLEPSYPELVLIPVIQRALPLAQRILDFERRAQHQFPSVRIPYDESTVFQEMTPEALRVRSRVEAGETLYRLGTRRINETGSRSQFWSLENPTNPGYGQRYAMPPQNYRNANFIERGVLRRGADFVTKKVSSYTNAEGETFTGDGIEVVVPEGSVHIEGHHSL
jgi:hypothetical protein